MTYIYDISHHPNHPSDDIGKISQVIPLIPGSKAGSKQAHLSWAFGPPCGRPLKRHLENHPMMFLCRHMYICMYVCM